VRPFRLGDSIELLDVAEKPGARGRVVDINMLYTSLEDSDSPTPGTLLQIPNTLIFQRVVRRWKGGQQLPPRAVPPESTALAARSTTVIGGSSTAEDAA
jgi:small-conductance mechanosensitive channel